MRSALVLAFVPAFACGPTVAFVCSDDADCEAARGGGRCEPTGYCSFPDAQCPNGRRYGTRAADDLAGECVVPEPAVGDDNASDATQASAGSGDGDELDDGVLDDGPLDDGTATTNDADDGNETTGGTATWWDCDWSERVGIAIDAPPLAGIEHDVPIAIVLDSSRIDYGITANDGADVRVVVDGATVPHEIEAWDPAGTSWIWIAVPQLPGSPAIELYYGANVEAADASAAVWGATHVAVWHLGAGLAAAGGAGPVLVSTATAPAAGVVADGRVLNAAHSALVVDATALDDVFSGGATVSMWIDPDSWGAGAFGRLLDKSSGGTGEGGWMWTLANAGSSVELLRFVRDHGGWNADIRSPAGSITLSTWQHVALVYDDDDPYSAQYFIDGVAVATDLVDVPLGDPIADAGRPLVVGNRSVDFDRVFEGTLDEVRVSAVARSADWIALEALGARDQLLAYGPAEAAADHGCP